MTATQCIWHYVVFAFYVRDYVLILLDESNPSSESSLGFLEGEDPFKGSVVCM